MTDEIRFLDASDLPPRRPRWRLRILAGLSAGLFLAFGFAQLDRSTAARLGPLGEVAHDLLSPREADHQATDSAAARRFKAEVRALRATPSVAVIKPGVLGTFGRVEHYSVVANDPAFDDAALAELAAKYGDRITNLLLQDTAVTDAGLAALAKFPRLHQLAIGHHRWRARPGAPAPPPCPITDAGLAHLRGLNHLDLINLNGLPIPDAGLDALRDLPNLNSLYLFGTQVRGQGLARFRSLPRLSILYLDDAPLAEDGLKALAGATALRLLSLKQVPLEPRAVPLLRALPPGLDRLELTGCGLLDEEVATLKRPGLKIIRQ